MTPFAETRLELGIDYGAIGGPTFSTTIVATGSGYEYANVNWHTERGRWEIGERIVRKSEHDYLLAFFRARRGMAQRFRFKDWADYVCTHTVSASGGAQSQGILKRIGATDTYQIVKRYQHAGETYDRPIVKPVVGTVRVYRGGVEIAGYTVDYTTGIVSFGGPQGDDLMAVSCEFDVPARFDTDQFRSTFEAYDKASGEALFTLQSLPVVEVRV